jgi:hypothetical protein
MIVAQEFDDALNFLPGNRPGRPFDPGRAGQGQKPDRNEHEDNRIPNAHTYSPPPALDQDMTKNGEILQQAKGGLK